MRNKAYDDAVKKQTKKLKKNPPKNKQKQTRQKASKQQTSVHLGSTTFLHKRSNRWQIYNRLQLDTYKCVCYKQFDMFLVKV
jgi:hypothetical protein